MKLFCSQWLPKVWNPWTSPDAEFLPLRCLAGLYCSHLWLLLIFDVFVYRFVLRKWKPCSIGLRSGGWFGYLRALYFFAFRNFSVAFICLQPIYTVKHRLFVWIWAERSALLYTFQDPSCYFFRPSDQKLTPMIQFYWQPYTVQYGHAITLTMFGW